MENILEDLFDADRKLREIDFHVFKDRFLNGFDCNYTKEWVPACEQYVIEFGDIGCAESYDDVIERLSEEYRRRTDKKYLRRYLRQRLQKDLGI